MNDLDKLKCELIQLVELKDYKTANTLLRGNPNAWMFNTPELSEELSCDEKHFTNRAGAMKFETRPQLKDQRD